MNLILNCIFHSLPPGSPVSVYSIVAGTTDLSKPGETKQVEVFHIHKGFSFSNHSNDIALIKVKEDFYNQMVFKQIIHLLLINGS